MRGKTHEKDSDICTLFYAYTHRSSVAYRENGLYEQISASQGEIRQ